MACRSAYSWISNTSRNTSKNGWIWFLEIFSTYVSTSFRIFYTVNFRISIIAIIYTSLVALMQDDMKKLIAYSSVAHMGYVTLGIFTFNKQGIEGVFFR